MAQYGRSIIVTNDGATRFTGGASSTFNIDADGRFDLGTNTIEGAQEQTAIYVEEVCVNTLNIRAKNGAKVKVNVPSGCDGMVMDVEILGCGECDVGSVVEVVFASRVNFKEIQLLETTNTTASDYNGQSFRYTSSFPTYIDHMHLSTMGLNAKVSIEAPLEYINWCLLPGNDTDGYGTANFYGAWTNGKNCTTYDRGRWDLYSTAESSSDIQVTGLTASSRSSGTMCCARPGCSPPVDPEETCASGSRCAAEKDCGVKKAECDARSSERDPNTNTCEVVKSGTVTKEGTVFPFYTVVSLCTYDNPCDDPCFSRDMYACRLLNPKAPAAEAYAQCFLGAAGDAATRTLMSELAAGDTVLSDADTAARVIVNQHKIEDGKASLLITLMHARGSLALTPDHVLELDGKFVPAREAHIGAALANGAVIEAISHSRGGIINPITDTGKILVAAATGEPVVAATGNEWLADVMLSAYPKYTLSYALAAAFPAAVQAYYDGALEPLFTAAVPHLTKIKAAAPAPLVGVILVAGDAALAVGFAAYSLGLKGVATLAVIAAAAARKGKKP